PAIVATCGRPLREWSARSTSPRRFTRRVMSGVRVMGRTPFMLVLLAGLIPALSLTFAQTPGRFNEREIRRPLIPGEAKQGIWVLDFRFKDPRLITVDIPGRGKRVVWYLWYQVINNTGEPRTFIPDFELMTIDKKTIHHDQVLPKAQMMIWAVEDAVGHA